MWWQKVSGIVQRLWQAADHPLADDFDVSVFLTPIGTRHSLLTKSKTFKNKSLISGNSGKLNGHEAQPLVIREESDEENATISIGQIPAEGNSPDEDDKKKLSFNTTYEGFSIWGWVLCLLVARKGGISRIATQSSAGQALMEEWIASTQQQQEED